MSIKIKLNYSPNFDPKKRKLTQIKFIVFHYTGMKKEKEAIEKLTDLESKVSCHYLIKADGEIIKMVPEKYISWHAGISGWLKFKNLNKNSIGIEISNPGHTFNYKKFSKKQISSLIKLSKYLIQKFNINSNFILGHSDIAPDRKQDPGEKFPWKLLSKKNIGIWHNLSLNKLTKERNHKTNNFDKKRFISNLYKIGYPRNNNIEKNKYKKFITKAFQRRFRQELINGIIDRECLIISENLLKNRFNFSCNFRV